MENKKSKTTIKILFTGGGTAGHIFPIIAVARELKKIKFEKELEFFYIGCNDEFQELLQKEGFKVKKIFAGKIRRYWGIYPLLQNLFDIFFKIPLSFLLSFFYIFFISPDLIFSKGGYGAFFPSLAGWMLNVPLFLHESDAVPGLSNKILNKFATEVFLSFPLNEKELKKIKGVCVGNPIRQELLEGLSFQKAEEMFKLQGGRKIILIIGGSQGAQKINELILNILPKMIEMFEVIHVCGKKNFKHLSSEVDVILKEDQKKYYHLYPFLNEKELKHAYFVSDLIVSRAGAGSIFEIAAFGKPSILIPLPSSAQDHQIKNAYIFSSFGCCIVLEQENLTPNFFLERLKFLFERPNELKKMGERAKEFSRPYAAKIIANYIAEYLQL